MTKKFSASVLSGTLIAALSVLVPASAFAISLNSSNFTISNSNSGSITSSTNSTSSTGGNSATGSSGGNGGSGGNGSVGGSGSCSAATATVVSDATATFSGVDGTGNAVVLTYIDSAWTASIPGASWIWARQGPSDPTVNQTDTFTDMFNWNGTATGVDLYVAGDNYYTVLVNGNNITGTNGTNTDMNYTTAAHYTVPVGDIVQGSNALTVIGENEGVAGSNDTNNPAGVLYKLVVAGQQCGGSQNTGGANGGNGGNGGSGGSGGVIITGKANSKSTSVNVVGVTKTFVH